LQCGANRVAKTSAAASLGAVNKILIPLKQFRNARTDSMSVDVLPVPERVNKYKIFGKETMTAYLVARK